MEEYEIKNKMMYVENSIADSKRQLFNKSQKLEDLTYFIRQYRAVKDKVVHDIEMKQRKFSEHRTYLKKGKATKKYSDFIEDFLNSKGVTTLQKVEVAVEQLERQKAILEEQIYDIQRNVNTLNNNYDNLTIELRNIK